MTIISEEECNMCSPVPPAHRAGMRQCLIDRIFIDQIDFKPKPICDACLKAHWDRCIAPRMPSRWRNQATG
jgi:hypothetical protein